MRVLSSFRHMCASARQRLQQRAAKRRSASCSSSSSSSSSSTSEKEMTKVEKALVLVGDDIIELSVEGSQLAARSILRHTASLASAPSRVFSACRSMPSMVCRRQHARMASSWTHVAPSSSHSTLSSSVSAPSLFSLAHSHRGYSTSGLVSSSNHSCKTSVSGSVCWSCDKEIPSDAAHKSAKTGDFCPTCGVICEPSSTTLDDPFAVFGL